MTSGGDTSSDRGPDDLRVEARPDGAVSHWLDVEVAAPRVGAAFTHAYRELSRSARIRGFRPGKAPVSLLRRLYGAAVAEDVERQLVADTLPAALARAGLEPVSQPSIDSNAPEEAAAFHYRARIEVKPALELGEISGLAARRLPAEVGEEDVERELESLRQRQASLVEVSEDERAETGHFVTLDYAGRIDAEPFEGGAARDVTVELGAGQLLPGFDEQLAGARAGEERAVRTGFPEDFGDAALAGKNAEFQVRVLAIRRREVPALDDEFAKDLGEFETLDQVRARIRDSLCAARLRRVRLELRRSVLDALMARVPFEVPAGLVHERLHRRLHAASQDLSERGARRDVVDRQLARWEEEWRPAVEREIREEWLLQEVAKREGLALPDDELEERLTRLAEEQGSDAGRLRKRYREAGMEDALREQLLEDKAVEFLLAAATVEDVAGP